MAWEWSNFAEGIAFGIIVTILILIYQKLTENVGWLKSIAEKNQELLESSESIDERIHNSLMIIDSRLQLIYHDVEDIRKKHGKIFGDQS